VFDPDANKMPTSAETLSIGDETVVIPTIVMGSPMTLANSDGNDNLKASAANHNSGVQMGANQGTPGYTLTVHNTTDNSERLRILASACGYCGGSNAGSAHTHTWINVTTAHSIDSLVNLPGTAVLNYDISGPAGDLSSTAVAVYVLGTGKNSSGTDLDLVTSGNARAGVVDLDDGSQWIK
jgi:hypothetical protein